jgi:hypothetical protein
LIFLDSVGRFQYHVTGMRERFPYDVRAVLTAPGKGLALKKIFASGVFLFLGYVLYTFFTYFALLYDQVSFGYIWESYDLFPIRLFSFDSHFALALHICGMAMASFCLSMAIMAVAAINFQELRGSYFYSARNSIRFTLQRSRTLALGYGAIAAFVGFVCLLGVLTGLIGRIPVLGGLAIGVFYMIPIFLTLIFTVFIIFVGVVGIMLLPVIIAAQKEASLFDALVQLFSVIIKEPIRFFWYLAVTSALAKGSSFVMAYFYYRTVQLSRLVMATGGGERIDRLFSAAFGMLPTESPIVRFMTHLAPGWSFGFEFTRWGYGGDRIPGAIVLAVSFFLLFLTLLGYMISVLASGLANGYVIIRMSKDKYSVIDEAGPSGPADQTISSTDA